MWIDRFFERHPIMELITATIIIVVAVLLGIYWLANSARII